ncbi:MAG: hemagglutinin repeat-containing protein [Legionellaceae bacterium]|nr:hemagglutinin repeat-containing protein [Legionellaceae bacterium]
MSVVFTGKYQKICRELGLKITAKPVQHKTKTDVSTPSVTHQILKDTTGNYNLTNLALSPNASGTLLDGDKKILSWHLSDNYDLIIDIECESQVNVWDNLAVKNLFVKSKGPLLMGGKVDCTHSMITKSLSFATLEPINCRETLVVEASNGAGFFSPISSKCTVVKSSTIYQTDSMDIKEQADFTCKLFSSEEHAKLASPVLRIISENTRLSGQVDITNTCLITAKQLTLGQDQVDSMIALAGESRINVDTLTTIGDSQLSITGHGELPSHLVVERYALIHEKAHVTLENISSDMGTIDVAGTLKANQTALSCENILNSGVCEVRHGQLVVNQSHITKSGGQLKLSNTHAIIHQSRCLDGQAVYDNALVLGKAQFILKGSLSVTNQSKLCLTDVLRSGQHTSFEVSNSTVSNGQKAVLRGSVDIHNATLEAPVIQCHNPHIKAQQYKLKASKEVLLSGQPELRNGSIDTKNLLVEGEVTIDDARFYVTHSKFKLPEADIKNMRLRAKTLELGGGISPEMVQFTRCSFNTEHISTSKQVKLSFSNVNIIGGGEKIQSLGENVVLDQTRLISKKRIIQEGSGRLKLEGHSHFSAPEFYSQGEIESYFSTMFGQRLSQIKGALKGKGAHIYLTESLGMLDSDASLGNQSTCVVPEIRFCRSQSALTGQSSLIAPKSITIDAESTLTIKDALAASKDINALGNLSLDASLLAAENITVYQAFDIANHSQVDAEGLITAAKNSVTILKDSQIKAKQVDLKGNMSVSAGLLKAEESVNVAKESTLTLDPQSVVMAKNMDIYGSVDLRKAGDQDGEELVPAQLRIDEKLKVHSDAKISGEGSLLTETQDFLNFGSINIGDNLISRGARLYNFGKISADSIYFGYDDTVVNSGFLSARNMTVHSNFVNLFGDVAVKQSLTCSGLYSLNLGAIVANNYSNTNLLSVNAGLILPNFSADAKYIFSASNLMSAGRIIMTTIMPGYSNLINLGFMVPGIVQSGATLYDLYRRSSFDDLKKMRRHEWMPYVGQIHSFTTLGINAATTGFHTGYELNNIRVKGVCSGFAKPQWKEAGLKVATLFSGSYRDSSLAHLNFGASVAGSTTKSNFLHSNVGLETSVLAHAINTHWLYNRGISAGSESSFTASSVYNDGALTGTVSFFMDAENLNNGDQGHIKANNGIVKTKVLNQKGELEITEGMLSANNMVNTGHTTLKRDRIEIGHLSQEAQLEIQDSSGEIQHFHDQIDTETDIKNSAITGKTFETQGLMDLDSVSLNYEEWIHVQEQGQVQSKNVCLKTAEFENSGHWEYEEVLNIHAEKATITETGVVNGAKTDEADLFKEKDKSEDTAPDMLPLTEPDTQDNASDSMPLEEPDSDGKDSDRLPVEDADPSDSTDKNDKETDKVFDPQHVFILDADEVDIDGQLTGGDYTQIRGRQDEQNVSDSDKETSPAKSQHVYFGRNAHVDLKYGSIKAEDVVNTGHLHLDGFSLNIEHVAQNGQAQIERTTGTITQLEDSDNAFTKISESVFKGDTARFHGHVDACQSAFDYETSVVIDSTAETHSNNVQISTKEFVNTGNLEYENYLEINADHVLIAEGAVFNGKRTSEDELFQEKPQEKVEGETSQDQAKEPKSSDAEPAKKEASSAENSEKTSPTDGDEKTGDTEDKEPEKEFKPKHILAINTKKLDIDGKMSGGDYTQIHGGKIAPPETPAPSDPTGQETSAADSATGSESTENEAPSKCESIHIGKHADVNLHYGNIAAVSMDVEGDIGLKGFSVEMDQTKIRKSGHFTEEQTSMKGIDLQSDGQFDLKGSAIDMSGEVRLSANAKERWEDSSVTAHQFKDRSHMKEKGQVAIFTDDYQHSGLVEAIPQDKGSDKTNLFYVESKTGSLNGKAHLDSAIYNIDEFAAAEAFIRGDGKYSHYQFSESLGVAVNRDVNLTGKVNRHCGLLVKGKSVRVNTNYKTDHDLTFISTQGAVQLSGQLNAHKVYGEAQTNIRVDGTVNADDLICLQAKGTFENRGGTLNGDTVSIKAKEIKNVANKKIIQNKKPKTPFRRILHSATPPKKVTFEGGIINAKHKTFLEATDGNIENHGGIIRAGEYAQLTATGDIKNLCNVSSHWNGYSYVNDYDAGLISGGTGVGTDDIGLYIKANGQVISDASDFISGGINYIEGDKGLKWGARSQVYVSSQWTSKKWYGKEETHTEYSTKVRGTTIQSGKYNILRTEHGGMDAVATKFSSPGGNLVYARDDINCYSIKTTSRTVDTKSSLWGLNKSKHTEFHEDATPTIFIDNGLTQIVSSEGTIDARGALFLGAGDLEMEAQHRIKFGCDVLNHEITDESRSFSVSLPGSQAYSSWKNGGSWADVATAEDAILAKLNRMGNCSNTQERLAHSANLGIDLYNTTSSVMRGLASDNLSGELLLRYGLGGADGFSPTLTFSMTENKQTTRYQNLGPGGVNKGGNVKLKAGDGVNLENGVRVHCDGNMDVDAPEVLLYDAALHSSFDQKTRSESVGITPTGLFQCASYSQSKVHAEATKHVNSELSTGGNLYLHRGTEAMDRVDLNGGNIQCQTLDADINHLNIRDKQDTSSSSTKSASASTTGQVSFYKSKSSSKITNQHSGIHVTDGINNNGHSVHVRDAYMEGGKITSDGKNNIEIDHLVATQLQDESHSSGFGISVNINDLGRLAGRQSTNETGEQAIATANVTYTHVHYEANQTSVIHGEQGTEIKIGELEGSIHTDSADGRTVTQDEKVDLVLDIPLTNVSYLESASKNIQAGSAKIGDMTGAKSAEQAIDKKELSEPNTEKEIMDADDLLDDDIDTLSDGSSDNEDFFEPEELGDCGNDCPESSIPSIGDAKSNEGDDDSPSEVKTGLPEEQWQEIKNRPKVQKARQDVQNKAEDYKNNPTQENEKALADAIKHSVMVILQEASENGWDGIKNMMTHEFESHIQQIIGSAENGVNMSTKTYMNAKGYLITFTFNLGLASIDSSIKSEDIIKEGAASATADIVMGIVIKAAAGEAAAGPIGWVFVGLDVLDSFFYDQAQVDKLIHSGIENLAESQRLRQQGRYFSSFGLQQLSADQMRAASLAQVSHMLARTGDHITDGVKWAGGQVRDGAKWVWTHTPPSFAKTKPPAIDDKSGYVSANQNSFFSNDKKQTQEEKASQPCMK